MAGSCASPWLIPAVSSRTASDIILSQMREQAQMAIDTADVIIFMVDVKQGLVDADAKVADMLRRSHKPVVLVVNKVDSFAKIRQ